MITNKLSVPTAVPREPRTSIITNRVLQLDDAVTRLELLSDELLGEATNEKAQPKVLGKQATSTAGLLSTLPEILDNLIIRLNERIDRIREGLI